MSGAGTGLCSDTGHKHGTPGNTALSEVPASPTDCRKSSPTALPDAPRREHFAPQPQCSTPEGASDNGR
eukprot:5244517-Alexandrium_andersonii.AAC.1